jgi:hypothetical protein
MFCVTTRNGSANCWTDSHHGQIRDAFRGAGYSLEDVEGFSEVLESRIAALTDL